MKESVIFNWVDKTGQLKKVPMETKRFTIGRSKDSSLVINDSVISPHHALIEMVENSLQITDCGSVTNTFVNGKQITKSQILHNGDIILLGDSIKLTVLFNPNIDKAHTSLAATAPQTNNLTQKPLLISPLIIMFGLIILILGIGGLLLFILPPAKDSQPDQKHSVTRVSPTTEPTINPTPTPLISDNSEIGTKSPDLPLADEQIEKAAIEVVRRISNDDKPYIFPEGVLKELKTRIDKYQHQASLVNTLMTLNPAAEKLAVLARQEGIEPALLLYIILAQAEGSKIENNLNEVAKLSLEQLVTLRATFGGGSADSSLIIIAAYRMGGGTKKSHPLLAVMRKIVKNPQTERNIWFLHEKGGISDNIYNFVLDFLTLGVIAQNPQLYGIKAIALSY